VPAEARRALLRRLRGRLAALARHRAGAHFVLRLWRAAAADGDAKGTKTGALHSFHVNIYFVYACALCNLVDECGTLRVFIRF
jgi:hypothetical protein